MSPLPATMPTGEHRRLKDPLDRFVDAQAGGIHERALSEIVAGCKRSHWMWFVLPQLRGLGRSAMAERYGLSGAAEARAYAGHPVLGPRLVACVTAMLGHADRPASDVLGAVDAVKLRSCLTLFEAVAPEAPCFAAALDAFYRGERDPATLDLIFPPRGTGGGYVANS